MGDAGLRPLSVGETLDAAIRLYLRNARVLIRATAVVVIPCQILVGVILASTVSTGRQVPGNLNFHLQATTNTQTASAANLGGLALNEIIRFVVSVLVLAVCIKAISDAYLDQPTSVGASLRFAKRRVLALTWMNVLKLLGMILGFVLLIIPGIWLYVAWTVAAPVLLIEGRGPVKSLGRSRRLVRGRWWAVCGTLLLAELMLLLLTAALDSVLIAVANASSNPSVLAAVSVSTLAGIVAGVLVQPFVATVVTVVYYDLRIRHEGYDIELLASQLELPDLQPQEVPAVAPLFTGPIGPQDVGKPGGPPYWPPPPGWSPDG